MNEMLSKTFGRWTVLSRGPNTNRGETQWCCRCECGEERVITAGSLRQGNSKSCGCFRKEFLSSSRRGALSPGWKGGKWARKDGYVGIQPGGKGGKVVLEHRLVMENFLGRSLLEKETVHHKNGVRNDNRIENLELKTSSHGEGQSIEDLKKWAIQFLKIYAPETLA